MTNPRRCVFYRTLAIVDDAMSGSDMRPAKVLEAFRQLDYDVDVVAGDANARKLAANEVKRKVLAGVRYDFVYAEPPTTPVLLNESHHLDLTPLLKGSTWAASRGLNHELTICCHEAEWSRRHAAYDRYLGAHIKVVHNRNRRELLELYSRQDIAVMPYGTLNSDWAMPVKFPEAIGLGLPVIAGSGTAVARMVAEQGIGWSVDASEESLGALLNRLDQDELERVRSNVKRIRPQYAWAERAREVAAIAEGLRAGRGAAVARLKETDRHPLA